jgi:hypothetical protein
LNLPSLNVTTGKVGIGTAPHADARLYVAGVTAFADDGVAQDSTAYGSFGVTRSSAVTGIPSYISLTRAGQMVYALGISDSNLFAIGPPGTNKKITDRRFGIDTAGRVTLPFQPAIWGRLSGNDGSSNFTTSFSTVGSRGTGFTNNSSSITVLTSGWYNIVASMLISSTADTYMRLKVNGTDHIFDWHNATMKNLTVTTTISLSANDSISLAFTGSGSIAGNWGGESPHNWFGIHFLG